MATFASQILVDWDGDGLFANTYSDITTYIMETIMAGGLQGEERVASAAVGTAILRNDTRLFSPLNASSALYGKIVPYRRIKVIITQNGVAYTKFNGYILDVDVDPGRVGTLQANLTFTDVIGLLQNLPINIPIQINKTGDQLVKAAVNWALNAGVGTQFLLTKEISGAAIALNDTLTINGVIYTFNNTIASPYQVAFDAAQPSDFTGWEVADCLARAINNAGPGGPYTFGSNCYNAATPANSDVTAVANPDPISRATGGLYHVNDTIAAGNPVSETFLGASGVALFGYSQQSPAANGDTFTRPFTITVAGLYDFLIQGYSNSDCGKLDIYFDNVLNSTIDYYNASVGPPTLAAPITQTLIRINLSAGNHTLKGIVNGKNASSSGFNIRLFGINHANPGGSFHNGVQNSNWNGCYQITTGVVILTARLRGAVGNVSLAKSSAGITLGGSALTGGVDKPVGLTAYQTGVQTFPYAADGWDGEKQYAMTAIKDVTNSEWGMLLAPGDGTLAWKNKDFFFLRCDDPADMMLNASAPEAMARGSQRANQIRNRVNLTYTPRATLASGVIAESKSSILVPGQSGTERYNGIVIIPGGGSTIVTLPFVDPATGQPMAATNLTLPLVAGTDWKANTASDGSGNDYTGAPQLIFSIVVNGTNAEVSIKNTALGPLYVTMLKIRGVGLVKYNPATITSEDAASQVPYSRQKWDLNLPVAADPTFVQGLADYILRNFKDPIYRYTMVDFGNVESVGGVNSFSLDLGKIIGVAEYQNNVSGLKYLITGYNIKLRPAVRDFSLQYGVMRLDTFMAPSVGYGKVDDTTYGKCDQCSCSL